MSAEEEDRLDFGEDEDDRESEISLGADEVDEENGAAGADEAQAGQQDDEQRVADTSNSAAGLPAFDQRQTEDGRPLPAGWIRKVSSSKGETYYLNLETRKSTWDEPTEPAQAASPPPAAAGSHEKPDAHNREAQQGNTSASFASVVVRNGATTDAGDEVPRRVEQNSAMEIDQGTSARLPAKCAARRSHGKQDRPLTNLLVIYCSPLSRRLCVLVSGEFFP